MKFSAAALLLLSVKVDATSNKHTTESQYDDPHLVARMLQGKKANKSKMADVIGSKKADMSGGKKGDCTDGATVIETCEYNINAPGRYVLESNLNCERYGIGIKASDVHLDCQGYQIEGNGESGTFGIALTDADHVTVSNCRASNFFNGLQGEIGLGPWSDLIVRDSQFYRNRNAGMFLQSLPQFQSTVTVVDSIFNENGNPIMGAGIVTLNVAGNYFSTTMNYNVGDMSSGFVALGFGESTLIDVTANDNEFDGIASAAGSTVNVINSIACRNSLDLSLVNIAQANTCDSALPPLIGGLPVCQCSCDGSPTGSMSAADVAALVENHGGSSAWGNARENIFTLPKDKTIASVIQTKP